MPTTPEYEVTVSDVTTSASDRDSDSEVDDAEAEEKLARLRILRKASKQRAEQLEQKLNPVSQSNFSASPPPTSPSLPKQLKVSTVKCSVEAASERISAAAAGAKERKALLQKRYAWKKQFVVLSRSVRALDRECSSFVSSHKGELGKQMREVELELAAQNLERSKVCGRTTSRVEKAKWAMNQFMNAVEEVGTGDAYLERLKTLMEAAEKKASRAKETIAEVLEDGIKEETILQRQLNHFNTRLQQLQEKKSIKLREPSNPQTRDARGLMRQRKVSGVGEQRNDLSAKVTRIDAEIAALGGSMGGWDSREHQSFLQALSRLKITSKRMQLFDIVQDDICKLVEKVVMDAPTQTESSVRKHTEWYCKYMQLLEQKKDLVRSWKATAKPSVGDLQQHVDSNRDTPRKQKPVDKTEQALKKKKIAEWRRSKELKSKLLREEEQERRKVESRRQQLLLHKRQREKEKLALQKLEREAESARSRECKESSNEKEDQSRQANLDAKRALMARQERNMKLAVQRREANKLVKQKNISRLERIEQLHVKPIASATRDSSRLLKATKTQRAIRITPHDLDDYINRRNTQNAHDGVVPSAAGAERRAKGYGIALGPVSGKMVPSWKR